MIQTFTFPLGADFKADGMLKNYFETMLSGLTGNLDRLFYPFNTGCWEKGSFTDGGLEGWWPYEQYAYWLDGYVKCAYFSGNESHFIKAKALIDNALKVVSPNGFIGAKELQKQGEGNQWVHAVFFRSVMFLYEITKDPSYLEKITLHYLSGTNDYANWRETVNVETMLNCYAYTGDQRLLDLAVSAYEKHCRTESNIETKLSDLNKTTPIRLHAVTYNEMVKIPMLLYRATGEEKYLTGALNGLKRIDDNHLLPIGIHSGCESFTDTTSLSAVETCDITDHCLALYTAAKVTGDSRYLDRIERIMYNVAPSVMDKDFKTLQYFSSMNQVISTHYSNHSGSFTFTPRMSYQSNHYPECCTGNANRSMPNFFYYAVAKTETGVVFNFYLPGSYRFDGEEFTVQTDYPFNESVRITYHGNGTTALLRKPGWCKDFTVNGKAYTDDNGFVEIPFENGETVTIAINSQVQLLKVAEGYMVVKDPLVYTLKITPDIQLDPIEKRVTPGYPAYDMTPNSPWQIAIEKDLFLKTATLISGNRNTLLESDTVITAKAYFMEGVDLFKTHSDEVFVSDYDKGEYIKMKTTGQVYYSGELYFTPDLKTLKPTGYRQVDITLVPYGVALLRWTIFPEKV